MVQIFGVCPRIKRVHLSALKRFIGVSPKSPRHLIYGETGRYPLCVNTHSRCITFWLRITMLGDHRCPKKAYNMLLALYFRIFSIEHGLTKFEMSCTGLASVLYGKCRVWEIPKCFVLRKFKHRLIDCFSQDWNATLDTRHFYYVYWSFKPEVKTCEYVCLIRKNIC